ncbi:MAG: SDR family oxidoreductase [Zoogloeaceae bacterium]|jgi:uncharacterized protein YbjT (DUF2867 family)|nr:SDR family oxidoreductase [Zoogloeaceae bacterium]
MNILFCGADGFLGRAIAKSLEQAGHRVIRGVHHARQADDLAIDYRRDLTPEIWLSRLQGVDAVINAVGTLRELRAEDFERVHHLAPAALFCAAVQLGVAKIVQISAFGNPTLTPYMSSKHAADAALLEHMPRGATVLRPALVFGVEGDSTRFFMALASLPVLAIPRGVGKMQPVHVEDLAEGVCKLLESPESSSRILDFPGPRALDYVDWLESYRKLMGLSPAPHLPVPAYVMAVSARLAGLFSRSLFCRDTWKMLAAGNVAEAEASERLLERPLRDPLDFTPPEAASDLRQRALSLWRRPLLVGVLAALWLLTALVSAGIFPIAQSLALLAPFGLSGTAALLLLAVAITLDVGMGLLTLLRPSRRLWWSQLALIAIYTLLIAWRLPEFLLHPFAPVFKNLALVALLIQLLAEEQRA